ncbi:hypothetical protein MMC19_004444 [Ptychographa xylographoides]|nr:hypothetical protein [Ptychographa xylographoides]
MICQRCLYRLRASRSLSVRFTSSSTTATIAKTSTQAAPQSPARGSQEGPPPATSTSAAPPLSTPQSAASQPLAPASSSDYGKIVSSVPAGTLLKGLGYLKGKDPPLAKEVHEYPKWLWGLLDDGKEGKGENAEDQGDEYSKSKKDRRKAARAALKAAKDNPESLVPKIPIEHQSIDLPIGDGSLKGAIQAAVAREELRGAMRVGRRKAIKTANFLKSMR